MLLSIVVPCFNEEKNVRPFFDKAKEELGGVLDHAEFVFIDDGMNNYDVPPWAIKLVLQKEEI